MGCEELRRGGLSDGRSVHGGVEQEGTTEDYKSTFLVLAGRCLVVRDMMMPLVDTDTIPGK